MKRKTTKGDNKFARYGVKGHVTHITGKNFRGGKRL